MTQSKTNVLSSVLFGVVMCIAFSIMHGIVMGICLGVISGLIFGIIIHLFVTSKVVQRQTQLDNHDTTQLLYAGNANHFKGSEAVGGKLYLLADKLVFKSHHFNIQNHQLEIPLEAVQAVDFFKSLGIIPNGLKILLKDESVIQFVVNERKTWKAQIEIQLEKRA